MEITKQERAVTILLVILLLGVYGYFFPRWADPNQNSRLDMIVAVVEDGTFQIDPYVQNTVDYAKVGDHYYSDKAPGVAFLGIPVYAAVKGLLELPFLEGLTDRLANNQSFQATLNEEGTGVNLQKVRFAIGQVVLAFLFSAIPTAFIAVLIFIYTRRILKGIPLRLAIALAYGLLSPAFPYANAFYGHQLSAALLFWAFCLISSKETFSLGDQIGIGLLLGYTVVTEYPMILVSALLFAYLFFRLLRLGKPANIVGVVASGGVVGLLWMGYNTYIFGGPFSLGYSYSELWMPQHETGFMSLSRPTWDAFWGITFGAFRGLFYISPILLVALPGLYFWYRSRQDRADLLVTTLVIFLVILFNSSSVMWWGGFAVGPRYLLPMVPFLMPPAAYFLKYTIRFKWVRATLGILGAWSAGMLWTLTLAGQSFPPDTFRNPLMEYALPNWAEGNIARNIGNIAGFSSLWSLAPVIGFIALCMVLMWLAVRNATKMQASMQVVLQQE
ncbi:MAG: hypothetical protein GYA17_05245 [Chloroflexi bacterium]|nr:hypothetical protein [Chloroflexota bacterium]